MAYTKIKTILRYNFPYFQLHHMTDCMLPKQTHPHLDPGIDSNLENRVEGIMLKA